jgi:hypothetical protein
MAEQEMSRRMAMLMNFRESSKMMGLIRTVEASKKERRALKDEMGLRSRGWGKGKMSIRAQAVVILS